MSYKPLFTLALATSLILGIAQRAPAQAPGVYLCDPGGACDCEAKLVWWSGEPPMPSFDLCLQVGSTPSDDPPANCSPQSGGGGGAGDEVCGWELGVKALGGLQIESFDVEGTEILAHLAPPGPPQTSLTLNWLFANENNEPGPPLAHLSQHKLGTIAVTMAPGSQDPKLGVTAASRAITVGRDEVYMDPHVLLELPEPSRGALLLLGIATLLALSRRGRRSAHPLLLAPLLLASLAPPTRADEPVLSPVSPSEPMFAGVALAALGDVNGDRVTDLAIGRPDADAGRGQVVLELFRLDGTLHGTLLIGQGQGGFPGTLAAGANFGAALASPGDLDGDGIAELAVAAPGADQIWILFFDLGPPLRVDHLTSKSISLAGVHALAALGDLNGDGVQDLAAGHPNADTGCTQECGAVSLLALNADGSLSVTLATLENGSPNLPVLGDDMRFGSSLASLGDLDSDGSVELAVGAVGGGLLPDVRGSVEVLSLDALGTVVAHAVIDETSEGFMDLSNMDTEIGRALAALGDIDGNGTKDLAVSTLGPSNTKPGRVALLALGTAPGSILTSASLDVSSVPTGAVGTDTEFGRSLAALDIDADGDPELAVGAERFDPPLPPSIPDPIWLMALGDSDDDRRPNFVDNCELVHNPLQDDEDGDGAGNACDVCPHVFDPLQSDTDGDGTGDACEPTIIRLRPDSAGDPTIQRQKWTLEIECGASDITNVVVGLTPHDANVGDLEFGGGCEEPPLACMGCLSIPVGCNTVPLPTVGTDVGTTVDLPNSGALLTDANGQNVAQLPGAQLLRNSLYVVLQGDSLLCEAGDAPVFLGSVELTAPPGVNVNPQVTPSVTSLETFAAGVGPIRENGGATPDHYRVECKQCAYALQPSGARTSTKSAGSGSASVDYTLLPLEYTPEGFVEVWELCFAAEPFQLHRIALSVDVATAQTTMRWLGCGNATGSGVVEGCVEFSQTPPADESPYGSVYYTVDATKSLSYRASAEEELYLLLQGSLATLGADALNALAHMDPPVDDPTMTCVARLETLPAINLLDPNATPSVTALSGTSSLPSAVQDALLLPPFEYCEQHPVLDVLTDPAFPDCSGPGGQHNTSLATSVPDDMDGDERRFEDDNCPHTPNTDQSDLGGRGDDSTADGDGDACQCGDVDSNGSVDEADVAPLLVHLYDPEASQGGVEARCSVGGSSACTIHDAVILQRALIQDSFEGEFVGKCEADLGP